MKSLTQVELDELDRLTQVELDELECMLIVLGFYPDASPGFHAVRLRYDIAPERYVIVRFDDLIAVGVYYYNKSNGFNAAHSRTVDAAKEVISRIINGDMLLPMAEKELVPWLN